MKASFKITALLLVILLAVSSAACSEKKAGGGSTDESIVMVIDGRNITADEYNYFYQNHLNDVGENAVDEAVINTLREYYAVYNMADKYGIELDKNDFKEINSVVMNTINSYGSEEAYYAALSENHMTGDVYHSILEMQTLEAKVRSFVLDDFSGQITADDATVENDIRTNFIRVTHILIKNDIGDNLNSNKALSDDLLKRVKSGEDFNSLVREYGEDNGLDIANGYYITRGEFIESFEAAAFSLKEGEISGIVESVYGFHIIKRLPLEDDYINDYFEELRTVYKNRVFNEMKAKVAGELNVVTK